MALPASKVQQFVRHISVDVDDIHKYDVVKLGQFRGQLLLLGGHVTEPVLSAIRPASYMLAQ